MAIIYLNNVRTQLTAAATSSIASLSVSAGVSPFVTPPDPSDSAGICYLTLTDSLALPTRYEVVTYTGRTGAGPFTLTGVRRGQDGTQSESWGIDTAVYQAWTSRPVRQMQAPRINALMNPDFRIWQRGAERTAFTTSSYTADRWRLRLVDGGTWTANRVQNTEPDFSAINSLVEYRNVVEARVAETSIGAADVIALEHYIEGNTYRKWARKEKVATFWARANRTGTLGFFLQEGVASVSFINTFKIEATGTWEQKVMRIPAHNLSLADMSTTYGAVFGIVLAAGSNFTTANSNRSAWVNANVLATAADLINGATPVSSSYSFAAFGLYEGSDPPDFEIPDPMLELQRCKRHYQKSMNEEVSPSQTPSAAGANWYAGFRNAATDHRWHAKFSPELRRSSAVVNFYSGVNAANSGFAGVFVNEWKSGTAGIDFGVVTSTGFHGNVGPSASAIAGTVLVDVHWTADVDYP